MMDAGIIGFVPRGEYSDTETYDFLQFVFYGDSTYVAKKETTGNPPAENNEFWQLLAKGHVQGVSGVKGDKETDYRTGDVNITAANVGALPAENRMVSGDLKVKGRYFPLLNLVRNEYGQSSAIQLTCGDENQKGILLEGIVSSENATGATFQIRDRISSLVFLALSKTSKKIYDSKSGGVKEILVEGDAASLLKLLRTSDDVNYKPGKNAIEVKEFTNNSQNVPDKNYYHVITMQGQDIEEAYITQLALGMTVDGMYYRRMVHDNWGTWKRVLLDGDLSRFQPGETFSIPTNTPLAGILTTSAKEIYFTVPLPRSAAGRAVNVACTNLRVRGNAGYIIENKDISEYKVTVTVVENLLKICISDPSGKAFYDTNNIAVTVGGAFTVTFS